jgi:hypothetical protein
MGKMRFKRSSGIPLPVKTERPTGRPKKEDGEAAHRKIRISGKLLNMILDYREENSTESYNDTILSMLNRKTRIIIEQSERIKQLEYKIQQLIPADASPSIGASHIDERDSLR